jgi:hypothetical protein
MKHKFDITKKTGEVNFFIASVEDEKLRKYLAKRYLKRDPDEVERERELFMEEHQVRNDRANNVRKRK